MHLSNILGSVGLNHFLSLSALLFSAGLIVVLMRKNAIVILMGIELMLNGVNLAFVTFSHFGGNIQGQLLVFFVMTVAAAEAGVGLAIAVSIFKYYRQIDIKLFEQLKG